MVVEPSSERRRTEFGPSTAVRVLLGLIELWLVILVLILGIAFIMGLMGAKPEASFPTWIYARTDEIMRPFSGMFDSIELTGNFVIQPALLFAMAVYAALAAIARGVGRRLS